MFTVIFGAFNGVGPSEQTDFISKLLNSALKKVLSTPFGGQNKRFKSAFLFTKKHPFYISQKY